MKAQNSGERKKFNRLLIQDQSVKENEIRQVPKTTYSPPIFLERERKGGSEKEGERGGSEKETKDSEERKRE